MLVKKFVCTVYSPIMIIPTRQVEALEERVAAASMQVKGWRAARLALPAAATGAEIVARARHKLASLEAHVERRYLKPPLVHR